jgi:HSP20 family protein
MSLPTQRRPVPAERVRGGGWPRDFWDPFGEFTQLWNRMGQLFEPMAGQNAWMPAVEAEETDDTYMVRAELPGMRREDVNVELGGGELRVTGEVKEDSKGALRRRQGRFAYRTNLPADADAEKAEASMSDGVLTIRIPKTSRSKARKIEVGGSR